MEGDAFAPRVRTLDPALKALCLMSHADRLFEAKQQFRADERDAPCEAVAPLPAARLFEARAMTTIDDDKHRHDFKTQLGIILGFADLLLADAADDDPRRGDVEEIHKAATAALELLAHLFPAHESHHGNETIR